MKPYHLKLSPKTKLLNVFRTLFTIPVFEQLLVKRTVNRSGKFFKKLVPPDYLYNKNSVRYANRNGINFKLDISNVVEHYLYFGNTDASYAGVVDTIKNAAVILDIGANIGSTSMYFATQNAKAQIISFEPHPDTYNKAKANLSLNSFNNIKLMNMGLGEQKDVLKLYEVNSHNPGMNRILAEDKDLPYKEIEIDTLDAVMASEGINKVDFIKMDVEGFEYSVLKGAQAVLSKKPVLFIELDDNNLRENNHNAKELVSLIQSAGYNEIVRADNLETVTTNTDFSNCHFDIIAR